MLEAVTKRKSIGAYLDVNRPLKTVLTYAAVEFVITAALWMTLVA